MFTNFGRDVVLSADLCYNGDNEKASPLGRGGGVADGEGKYPKETPSHPLPRELSLRESLWMRATLGVWAQPGAFVIRRRNRR